MIKYENKTMTNPQVHNPPLYKLAETWCDLDDRPFSQCFKGIKEWFYDCYSDDKGECKTKFGLFLMFVTWIFNKRFSEQCEKA